MSSADLTPDSRDIAGQSHEKCRGCSLREPGMFCNFSNQAWERFEAISQPVAHPARTVLFEEGDHAKGIYVVCAGHLKLFATSESSRTMILKIARPGDVLGLSAALNDFPHEVTAETLEPGRFMHIGRGAFLEFTETSAEASRNLAMALAREHREFVLIARRLALLPFASGRLARILIEFAADNPEHTTGMQLKFKMMLTHGELASLAATSRETITRLLNHFERAGILSRENSIITILESEELQRLAGSHPSDRARESSPANPGCL